MEENNFKANGESFGKTFLKYAAATVVFIFIIPAVFIYSMFSKTWRIFTEKRIETLETIFQTDFPDDTDFVKYWRLNGMDGGADWLYINGISDPEDFCRSCVNIPIEFMADIKNANVIEYGDFSEDEAVHEIEYLSRQKTIWNNGERYTDFFCIFQSDGYRTMSLYFSKNNDSGYDVKFEIQ